MSFGASIDLDPLADPKSVIPPAESEPVPQGQGSSCTVCLIILGGHPEG